jgi:hypothetical protein
MTYEVKIFKANLPYISIEAPFPQLAAKKYAEKFSINDGTKIEVKNDLGIEVFISSHISLYYVRPTYEA